MDDLVSLISVTYTKDDIGQKIATQTVRDVWAHISSASRAEFFAGGQNGLRPSITITTPAINYEGEETVIVAGEQYSIYRTYRRDSTDEIELYAERKGVD